jgi:hypothetical protein
MTQSKQHCILFQNDNFDGAALRTHDLRSKETVHATCACTELRLELRVSNPGRDKTVCGRHCESTQALRPPIQAVLWSALEGIGHGSEICRHLEVEF